MYRQEITPNTYIDVLYTIGLKIQNINSQQNNIIHFVLAIAAIQTFMLFSFYLPGKKNPAFQRDHLIYKLFTEKPAHSLYPLPVFSPLQQ